MKESGNNKSVYIWNTIASILNSFQSAIILMVISCVSGSYDAGIFVIAYAIANLSMMIGKFGMRQFQISDMRNKYSYKEYVYSRKISIVLMILFSIIYISLNAFINHYSFDKIAIIFMWCLMRVVDAYEDVFHAELQKHNRLEIASKIVAARLFAIIFIFVLFYWYTGNLLFTTIVCVFFSFAISIILNYNAKKLFSNNISIGFEKKNVLQLVKECFSLFISSFLLMYIVNAPKYSIDGIMGEEEQAIFSYIFMPVFVISLFGTFIFQPMIVQYTKLWKEKELRKINNKIFQQFLLVSGMTLICIIGGKVIGLRILGIMYSQNLMDYALELIVLLVAGGFLALVNYLQMLLTIMREQKYILIGYTSIFFILFLAGDKIVLLSGIFGLCIFYAVCMFCLSLYFVGVICWIEMRIHKAYKKDTL